MGYISLKEIEGRKYKAQMRQIQLQNCPQKGDCLFVIPIKRVEDIQKMKTFLFNKSPRDYLLFVLGINNGLRCADLIRLKVKHVSGLKPGESIKIKETKTGKVNLLYINQASYEAIQNYLSKTKYGQEEDWLFPSQRNPHLHIETGNINLLIKGWCRHLGIKGNFGAHSLRKTFAYQQRISHGTPIELIMRRLNHSSIGMTLRYACIDEVEINGILENQI